MTQYYMLHTKVELPTTLKTVSVRVAADEEYTEVTVTDTKAAESYSTNILWSDVDDVELLAELFDIETVRVFRQIVKLLGRAYNLRNKD